MTDAPRAIPSLDRDGEWQEAVIESIVTQTPTVKTFTFRLPHSPSFLAGQHVDVRLTAPDGYTARRSYSITSAPGRETLELAIELLPNGEVSSYFHDVALVGDIIEIAGPFAEHFVWRPERDGSTLLVAGGSGVAPFLSMLRHRAFKSGAPPMLLVYSARTWNDVIFRDELLKHELAQQDLRIAFVITRQAEADAPAAPMFPRTADFTKRVDATMLRAILHAILSPPQSVFVCGNNGFVGTVTDALVDAGVPSEAIRTERYGE